MQSSLCGTRNVRFTQPVAQVASPRPYIGPLTERRERLPKLTDMACDARARLPPSEGGGRPRVDFQTQPVFDERDDDDDDGSKAHPKIIGMTDSGREGGKAYRRAAVFPSLP